MSFQDSDDSFGRNELRHQLEEFRTQHDALTQRHDLTATEHQELGELQDAIRLLQTVVGDAANS